MVQQLWKTFWHFLKKLNIQLPSELAVVLLGIYISLIKMYVHTKTCTWMFITPLCAIASNWIQFRYPSTGKWLKKLWYMHNNKKELIVNACDDGLYESSENYSEWQKSISKCYILFNSIYITLLKWQNYRNGEQINGCQGVGLWV